MTFILSKCFSVPVTKLAWLGFEATYKDLLYGSRRLFKIFIEKSIPISNLFASKETENSIIFIGTRKVKVKLTIYFL